VARLIPPIAPSDLKSPGESFLFRLFADDDSNWTVLHSLDLPDHVRQVSGEADFVVIAPAQGVLVIEVKGVDSVRRADGLWYLGKQVPGEARGPFRQAEEAMHSVRNRLIKRLPEVSLVPIWHCVVFPFVRFELPAVEWREWEVVDAADLRSRGLKASLERVLANARALLSGKLGHTFDGPSGELAARMVGALRGDFEVYESPGDRLARAENEVLRYTEEQFAALDAMAMNERVLFDGPAGSGKTVLASEAARREAVAGRRTLFLCFNRALARHLKEQLAGVAGLEVSGFHAKLLAVAGTEPSDRAAFWDRDLPLHAAENLLSTSDGYDVLVIDELQDLLHGLYFDCLDLLVRGGLRAGRWRAFGDLMRQRLYAGSITDEALGDRFGPSITRFRLTVNCRNTPRVAALAGRIADVPECYAHVRRPDDGRDPVVEVYASDADEPRLLSKHLERLQADGYRGDAVAVLSPSADAAAGRLQAPWRDRTGPVDPPIRGRIRTGTIHSFKGLEAAAVVLTDIDSLSAAQRDLVYVGCTRARHRLVVLASARVVPTIQDILLGKSAW
jgi:hypothetical protein